MKLLEFFMEKDKDKLSSSRLFAFAIVASAIVDWQHAVWTVGRWTPDYEIIGLLAYVIGAGVWKRKVEVTKNDK